MSIPQYPSYDDSYQPSSFPGDSMMPPMGPVGKNTMAIVALVVAIIGLLISWMPFVGIVVAIIGVVLAIIAVVKSKNYLPVTAHKGMSIIALVIAIFGTVIGLLFTSATIYLYSMSSECFTIADPTAKAQCIQEKINQIANGG